MPVKKCPQCGATHGARKLVCDCGYDFGCKRTGKAATLAAEPAVEPAAEPAAPSSGKRGKKVCPKCGAEHGARKLVCECGHDFGCKRSGKAAVKAGETPHSLYPEPGAWIADPMKGMPKIEMPEPLPSGLVSAEGVKEQVSYEGLGFCIYSYIPWERISDPELQRLWREARAAMQKIVEYLEGVSFSE